MKPNLITHLTARSSVEYEALERVLFRKSLDVPDDEYPIVLQTMAEVGTCEEEEIQDQMP